MTDYFIILLEDYLVYISVYIYIYRHIFTFIIVPYLSKSFFNNLSWTRSLGISKSCATKPCDQKKYRLYTYRKLSWCLTHTHTCTHALTGHQAISLPARKYPFRVFLLTLHDDWEGKLLKIRIHTCTFKHLHMHTSLTQMPTARFRRK